MSFFRWLFPRNDGPPKEERKPLAPSVTPPRYNMRWAPNALGRGECVTSVTSSITYDLPPFTGIIRNASPAQQRRAQRLSRYEANRDSPDYITPAVMAAAAFSATNESHSHSFTGGGGSAGSD